MKRLIICLFAILAIASCKKSSDFLDRKDDGALTEELVFTDSARTVAFLTRIYNDVGFSFNKGRFDSHGNLEQACDEAEYFFSGATQKAVVLYSGTMNPGNYIDEFWKLPYDNIRRANLMLSKLPTTPLSAPLKARMTAETRFLRAWYYAYLLKCFGGVPLLGDKIFGINDIINLPRNTHQECVDFLVKELDESAAVLSIEHPEQDYGRITKGGCMALKSRILLYAASPLFNGGANTADPVVAKLVSYPTYSVSYWQKAAQAADDVIKLNYYSLNVDNITAPGYGFYKMFLLRVNKEYIFVRNRPANKDFEGHYNPPTRGGNRYAQATQNVVDDFPMKNGKAITDPTSGYSALNPYTNRDPRFGYTVTFNGSLYYLGANNSKQPVNIYYNKAANGTLTAVGDAANTTTGYFVRKMCDDNTSAAAGANTERGWPLIRYSEILLNYAEAINETGRPDLAYPKLVEIRSRAGIDPGTNNLYGLKPNMALDEMREAIRTERRIELAYEDQRFFDVRRWKIAMQTDNGFNRGVQVVRELNGTFTYLPILSVRRHNFRPELYLLPIPQPEVSKMPALVQNPGY